MLEKKQTFNGLRTGNYLRGRVQVRYTHNVVLERNMKKKKKNNNQEQTLRLPHIRGLVILFLCK